MSEFRYLGCVFDKSGTEEAKCHRKVANGRRAAGAIRSLVNAMGFQLEYARVLHESLLMPVLMNGSETMIWKEKEMSKVRAVEMDNLRGLLVIRRMDKVPNSQIVRSDERVLQWFRHVERMENGRIARGSMQERGLVVVQWVGHGRDGLILRRIA